MTALHLPPSAPPAATPRPAPVRWWEPALLPHRWTPAALAVVAALLVLHLVATLVRLRVPDAPGRDPFVRLFDLDREMGAPAWVASVLLVLVAQALWQLSDRGAAGGRRRWVRHDRALAVVFAYLSLDELTALHDQTTTPLRRALALDGVLSYAWVVLFVPLALLVAALFLGWLRALPPVASRLVVLAGVLYVGGAAGLELVGSWLATQDELGGLTYALVVLLEEGLELFGALLMLSVVTWLRRQPVAGAGPRAERSGHAA